MNNFDSFDKADKMTEEGILQGAYQNTNKHYQSRFRKNQSFLHLYLKDCPHLLIAKLNN